MNDINDSLVKAKLKNSVERLEQKVPAPEQDHVFQENLNKNLQHQERKIFPNLYKWTVAAVLLLSISLMTVYIQSPFEEGVESHKLSELIESSSQIEQQLSAYDDHSLNAEQYAEHIRLRLEIEQIDQQLNDFYLSEKTTLSKPEIYQLWKQRINAAKSLKSVYQADSLVARI